MEPNCDGAVWFANPKKVQRFGLLRGSTMFQNDTRLGKPVRWVAGVLERSRDLVVLGGGMIGLALIVAVVVVGIHEREGSLRSTSQATYSAGNP